MTLVRFILPSLLLLLSACSGTTPQCAALPGGQYCLQPSTTASAVSVQQKVVARFGKQRETLIADIEADADGMQFVAITPFGQKVLHVSYDNQASRAILLPTKRLDAAQLLALLQIALWPEDAVRQGLAAELQLQTTPTTREVLVDGQLMLRISHDNSPRPYAWLRIEMPTFDVSLDMQTLSDINGSSTTHATDTAGAQP